jgi:predicted CoA-binding protein
MTAKKTVLIGATPDTSRYAYKAANSLSTHGHEVIPMGIKQGMVAGKTILRDKPSLAGVDTVTLYIGPAHQPEWYDYVLGLQPKRLIFNPGTENAEFESLAEKAGIEVVEGCTLVMLSIGTY